MDCASTLQIYAESIRLRIVGNTFHVPGIDSSGETRQTDLPDAEITINSFKVNG